MAQDKPELQKKYEYAWDKYSEKELKEVFLLNERYIQFMSNCKTERECIDEFVKIAEDNGYKNIQSIIEEDGRLKPGDKVYANNMGKTLAMFVIGNKPLDRKSTRLNSSHANISYAVFCLKKKYLFPLHTTVCLLIFL